MKIICKSTAQTMSANQKVNRVGKYLYNHLDGAIKIKHSGNMCDVYTVVLYQIPYPQRMSGSNTEHDDDIHEMILDLNITTYQNKIRVNIIETSPNARTIGYDLYDPDTLEDLDFACKLIFRKVCNKISKAYENYDFLF